MLLFKSDETEDRKHDAGFPFLFLVVSLFCSFFSPCHAFDEIEDRKLDSGLSYFILYVQSFTRF
jgi:hypothetical protein